MIPPNIPPNRFGRRWRLLGTAIQRARPAKIQQLHLTKQAKDQLANNDGAQ